MTQWDEVALAVESVLKTGIPSAKTSIIGGIEEYINGNVAQAINSDLIILLSRPQGDSQSNSPLLAGFQLKRFDIAIAIISKIDPTTKGRMLGVAGKKNIFDIQGEIFSLLEHGNLGGLVENKAGTNFEVGWSQLPIENKAYTCYQTVLTETVLERP